MVIIILLSRGEILEYCEVQILLEREQYYLDLLSAKATKYNIAKIAGFTLGVSKSGRRRRQRW